MEAAGTHCQVSLKADKHQDGSYCATSVLPETLQVETGARDDRLGGICQEEKVGKFGSLEYGQNDHADKLFSSKLG